MKTLKAFVPSTLLFFFLIGLAEQSFGGFYIHVNGAVQSYKNGIYQIKTKRGLIKIQNSKLNSALKKEINIRIGRRIQMGIPSNAILSYKKTSKYNRRPASQTSSKFKRANARNQRIKK